MARFNIPVAPIGHTLFIAGLFSWIVGTILLHLAGLGIVAAVGAVLVAIGPTLFWLGLTIILIDWILLHF